MKKTSQLLKAPKVRRAMKGSCRALSVLWLDSPCFKVHLWQIHLVTKWIPTPDGGEAQVTQLKPRGPWFSQGEVKVLRRVLQAKCRALISRELGKVLHQKFQLN